MMATRPEWLFVDSPHAEDAATERGQRYVSYGTRTTWRAGNPAVVVIGAFDGLHVGHRMLVSAACADATERGVACLAITFDPDPATELGPAAHGLGTRLLSCADRIRGLLALGADAVIAYRFDDRFAQTEPEDFVTDTLLPVVEPLSVHVGCNFHFGRNGAGNVSLLQRIGSRKGFAVHLHELVQGQGETVSATRIRKLIREAQLEAAGQLLGRCHYLRGRVEHGRGEGTSLGFPTANVRCDAQDCVPAAGVYAGVVSCGSRMWPAAINVGAPPTFASRDETLLEAHLLGFEDDLYGHEVCVLFYAWLRAERTFDSLEELEHTVRDNIAWVARHIGSHELEADSHELEASL